MEMKIATTLTLEGGVPRVIKVPSNSRPGVKHTCTIHCTCESFRYNGFCKHLGYAAVIAHFPR